MAIRVSSYLYTGSKSQALYKHGYFAASDLHTGTEGPYTGVPRSLATGSTVCVAFLKDKHHSHSLVWQSTGQGWCLGRLSGQYLLSTVGCEGVGFVPY